MSTTNTPRRHRALLVITSHARLGDSGRATGYTVSEAADAWSVFAAAGWQTDVTTVRGGRPPEDEFGDPSRPGHAAWAADPVVQAKLDSAPAVHDTDPAGYDVVYFVGGHGTMWDFPGNAQLSRLAAHVYERGGVVASVCHGASALTSLRLSDGSLLVANRRIAAFTDSEERAIGLDGVVPFLLQSRLEDLGADVVAAGLWEYQVVTDGRLVTGQNPASAAGVAEQAVAAVAGWQ
ncbi:type 1 glutamine amidotransferase domain-containing protein [Streptomyces sp. NBC_00513]|uniref:type 1 glutamine amidotransferase domain-containing protein n=1 Tax=unclassified Streptomyces TaxID=2593676 RepID=UPI0022502DF6|nr:type 1 glutamine amidotransferase domain-containing protein [Streptomyces sp. NBC_00424]MCX5071133.1 type 1 glutamine amidotransferase domain-containing protein [Streptomyces sp. NBC_00424]WUD45446.1 type 1 glutamine amidotransferase domain-containing protein [Streptomyces sp. NBC_00513]